MYEAYEGMAECGVDVVLPEALLESTDLKNDGEGEGDGGGGRRSG